MIGISINVNDRKVKDLVNNMSANADKFSNKEGWMIVQKFAKHIKKSAIFQFPRPVLVPRIKPKKIKEGEYGVLAQGYAEYVEHGTKPHGIPISTKTVLQIWAEKAFMGKTFGRKTVRTPEQAHMVLQRIIKKRGTRPRPFIRPGIQNALPDIRQNLKIDISRFVKNRGKI